MVLILTGPWRNVLGKMFTTYFLLVGLVSVRVTVWFEEKYLALANLANICCQESKVKYKNMVTWNWNPRCWWEKHIITKRRCRILNSLFCFFYHFGERESLKRKDFFWIKLFRKEYCYICFDWSRLLYFIYKMYCIGANIILGIKCLT